MSFSIQQLCRGCSSSSSFTSSSQFVVQVDGQQWDLSNLVLTGDDDDNDVACEPPPPPSRMEQANICSSNDDSSLMSEAMLAVISPSPPHARQRKQAAQFQRQSSLTSFSAQVFYPKHDVLQEQHDDDQQQHHVRRRSRQDMELITSSAMNQIAEDEPDAEMMCTVDPQHDVFRSMEPPQNRPQQHRTATFDDCSSLSSNSAMVTSQTQNSSSRQHKPSTTWIEVMPEQFLPLVGDSYATWQAIMNNHVHQVACDICHTQQYCMTTISTVFCSSCRSLFPNLHFTSGPGGLGLGMPMDDAHRELKRRNVKRPPPSSSSHRTASSRAAAPTSNGTSKQQEDLWSHRSCGGSSTDSPNTSFRNMVTTTMPH